MSGLFQLTVIAVALCLSSVTGIQFTTSGNQLDPANPPQETYWMNCTAAFLTDVNSLFIIKIERLSSSSTDPWELIASLTDPGAVISSQLSSYWQAAQVSGDKYPVSDADHPVTDSFLKVGVDASSLTCFDASTYRCSVIYFTTSLKEKEDTQNSSLTITAQPSTPALTAKHVSTNEMFVGVGLSSDNPANMDIGEQLEISCTADIGSDSLRTIQWRKSSEVGAGELIMYNGNVDEGTALPSSESGCRYTRTSTMQYNTTVFDANRNSNNMLRFLCIVNEAPSDRNKTFYVRVAGGSEGNQDQSVSKAGVGGTNVGAVVGGVIGGLLAIIIIVVVVWLIWFRNGSGESYKTKEEYGSENPNMAPQTDLYATPNKPKKKKHSSTGGEDSDDPLKPKPKPRAPRQELHYAELDLTKNPPKAPRRKYQETPVEYAEVEFKKECPV